MRVCRFGFDEMVLTGFYADEYVIPLDQAAEAYSRDIGVELLLPATEDLLDLLPPDGSSYEAACELHAWVEQLDVFERDELTIPASDVRLLVPIAALPSCSFWPAITPSTSPNAAARPPSGKRRFPMYS